MPAGRPTKCTDKLITKARKYIGGDWKSDDYAAFPSLTHLSLYLGIDYDTVKDWRKNSNKSENHKKFSAIAKKVKTLQRHILQNGGASGKLAPKIVSLLLSQHGVVEKKETVNTNRDDINVTFNVVGLQKGKSKLGKKNGDD